jgi:hypothetical protein
MTILTIEIRVMAIVVELAYPHVLPTRRTHTLPI